MSDVTPDDFYSTPEGIRFKAERDLIGIALYEIHCTIDDLLEKDPTFWHPGEISSNHATLIAQTVRHQQIGMNRVYSDADGKDLLNIVYVTGAMGTDSHPIVILIIGDNPPINIEFPYQFKMGPSIWNIS